MGFSRRQFLTIGASFGAAGLLPTHALGKIFSGGGFSPLSITGALKKYVTILPRPGSYTPIGTYNGLPLYKVRMSAFQQRVHPQLPPTRFWGYGGSYPGKTLLARKGEPFYVQWVNDIEDTQYLIPGVYDDTLMGCRGNPEVRTVVHVHGGHVPPESDGNPRGWFTRHQKIKGPTYQSDLYRYPNNQDATTLWYHDHALGTTRLNVYAGLAGFYIVRDDHEDALNLPGGEFEVPMVIQDRMFHADGSLAYPVRDPDEVPTDPNHPGTWVPEFFGDIILVNGKVWPHLDVEPRRYRFRILNGSNSRFYILSLDSGQSFVQIGTDQGLMPNSVSLRRLVLAPAERADVIVDFAGMAGKKVVMVNSGPDGPFQTLNGIVPADPNTTGTIMQFRVNLPLSSEDTSSVPPHPRPWTPLDESTAAVVRDMTLEEEVDDSSNPIESSINGRSYLDPLDTMPVLGSVEVWNLVNLTGDAHPIHLHLVAFQLLDRIPFDAERYEEDLESYRSGVGEKPVLQNYYTGVAVPPARGEIGPKDTVKAYPGFVTRIIARFDDYIGTYPWHCHIVEHEDNDMMSRFRVVPASHP